MDYRELHSALIVKGACEEDRKSHHVFYFMEVDGKSYRATKVSHSARGQISAPILSAICKQMRLTNRELREFINCSIGRERWFELWRQRS